MQRTKTFFIGILLFISFFEFFARFIGIKTLEEIEIGVIDNKIQTDLEFLLDESGLLKESFLQAPHPFFAFGPQNTYQNIRFENDDYYRQLQKDENKVAIFGGSVANNLFKLEELNDPKYFSEKLNLDIKEIKNFALKGSRQPQQLNIANIYAHSYSLAINIEGRNEMVGKNESHPPYFPHQKAITNVYYGNLSDLVKISELKKIAYDYQKAKIQSKKTSLWIFKTPYFYFLTKTKIAGRKVVSYANNLNFLKGRSAFHKKFYTHKAKLKRWLRYSCQQQNLQASFGIKSYFVIQPKPHYFKNLTKEEKQLLKESNEYEKMTYHEVINLNLKEVKKTGLNLIDATKVFDKTTETVYVDNCCHLNNRGKLIFLNFILENISTKKINEKCKLDQLLDLF